MPRRKSTEAARHVSRRDDPQSSTSVLPGPSTSKLETSPEPDDEDYSRRSQTRFTRPSLKDLTSLRSTRWAAYPPGDTKSALRQSRLIDLEHDHYDDDDDDDFLDGITTPPLPGTEEPMPPPAQPPKIDVDGPTQATLQAAHDQEEESLDKTKDTEENTCVLHQANSISALSSPSSEPQAVKIEDEAPSFAQIELDFEVDPMLEELRQLMEAEADDSDTEDETETYEERRLRKLRANEALLAQLGLGARGSELQEPSQSSTAFDIKEDERNDSPKPGEAVGDDNSTHEKPRRKQYLRKLRLAADGTTAGLPPLGMVLGVAYVDLPVLRDRARNEYCFISDVPEPILEESLSEHGDTQVTFDDDTDSVLADDPEARRGKGKRGRKPKPKPPVKPREPRPGMDDSGTSCHQCRRKTPEEKMRCSFNRDDHQCTLFFCARCLRIRYDIAADPKSTTFKCPRCEGYCNCSICLRKSGLNEILNNDATEDGSGKKRTPTLTRRIKGIDGQLRYKSVKEYVQAMLSSTPIKRDNLLPQKARGAKRGRPPKTPQEKSSTAEFEDAEPLSKKRRAAFNLIDGIEDDSKETEETREEPETSRDVASRSGLVLKVHRRSDGRPERIEPIWHRQLTAQASAAPGHSSDSDSDEKDIVADAMSKLSQAAAFLKSMDPVTPKRKSFAQAEENVWVRGPADMSSDVSDTELDGEVGTQQLGSDVLVDAGQDGHSQNMPSEPNPTAYQDGGSSPLTDVESLSEPDFGSSSPFLTPYDDQGDDDNQIGDCPSLRPAAEVRQNDASQTQTDESLSSQLPSDIGPISNLLAYPPGHGIGDMATTYDNSDQTTLDALYALQATELFQST